MSEDQAPNANQTPASPPTGLEDYFGEEVKEVQTEDQADSTGKEKVNSGGKENKEADADTTKENKPEGKTNDKSKGESKKAESKKAESKKAESPEDKSKETDDKTTTKKEEGKDSELDKSKDKKDGKETVKPDEFEVAGTKYSTLDEAIKAVNRINGDNTRLSGDVKSLRKEKTELQTNLTQLSKLVEDLKTANKAWQEWSEGKTDNPPDVSKIDLSELVDKKIKEIREQEKFNSLKEQFDQEWDEIFEQPDIEQVKPILNELVEEFGGTANPKVSPKKLYERAKKLIKEDKTDDEKDIDKLVEKKAEQILAQREAAKNNANAGGSGKEKVDVKAPPGLEDYFNAMS